MQSILVEFSYLSPEIREEFLGVLKTFVDEKFSHELQKYRFPVPVGERVEIGDIWVQSKRLVLVEFKCQTPRIRNWFLRELKFYINDGIAADLPYEEQVVEYNRIYVHIEEYSK